MLRRLFFACAVVLSTAWAGFAQLSTSSTETAPVGQRAQVEEDISATRQASTDTASSAAGTGLGDPTTGPAADSDSLAIEILPAPTDDEEIDERLKLLDRLLKGLPTTQPATQPASQPEAEEERQHKQALWPWTQAMRAYRAELEGWKRTRASAAQLRSPESQTRLEEQITEYRKRRDEYQARKGEAVRFLWMPKLDELDSEFAEQSAELARLSASLSAREQQRTSLLKQREEIAAGIKSSLAALKQYVTDLAGTDLSTQLANASTDAERDRLLAEKRTLEWRHNLFLLRAAALPDHQTQIDLSQRHDTNLLSAVTEYVTALREYRQKLEESRTQSEAEYAKEQLERSDLLPYMRSYWRIRLEMAQALADFRRIEADTEDAFTQEHADQLEARISRGRWYVSNYLDSLDRRPAIGVLEVFSSVGQFLNSYRARVSELEGKLDLVTDRLRLAQDRRDQVAVTLRGLREQLDKDVQQLQGEALKTASERVNALIADYNRFSADIDGIIAQLEAARERLTKVIPLVEEHTTRLARARVSMYRRYLVARGPNFFETDWRPVGEEWRSLISGRGNPGKALRESAAELRQSLAAVPGSYWAGLAILVLITAVLAARIARKARRWARNRESMIARDLSDGHSDTPLEHVRPDLVTRTHLQAAYLIAGTALPLWPLIVLSAGIVIMRIGGAFTVHLAGVAFGVAVVYLGYRLIGAAFGTARPHLRLVASPDTAAAYHRRWLSVLWTVLVLTASLTLLTYKSSYSSVIVATIWDVGIKLFLLLAIIYTARRRYFQPLMSGPDTPLTWSKQFYRVLWLACPLILLALLVASLAGYRGLTDYIFNGLLLSAGTLVVAKLLRSLLASRMPKQPAGPVLIESAEQPVTELATRPLMTLTLQIARFMVSVGTLVLLLAIWGISPLQINDLLQYGLLTTTKGTITTWRILAAGLTILGGLLASRTLRGFVAGKVFVESSRLDRGAQAAILILLHYAIIGLVIYLALELLFIDLGALTILFGTLGLGLGLGLQPLFVNFISGIMILLERQVKVGDLIELDNKTGEITSISMRSTTMRNGDNIEVVIPNADFITGRVVNWTLSDKKIRARVDVGVSYGADVELVRKVLLDIAYQYEDALVEPPPQVWFTNFGASSLDFALVCWFATPDSRWKFLTTIRFEILRALAEHNIEIPFATQTLTFASDQSISVRLEPSTQQDAHEPPPTP